MEYFLFESNKKIASFRSYDEALSVIAFAGPDKSLDDVCLFEYRLGDVQQEWRGKILEDIVLKHFKTSN